MRINFCNGTLIAALATVLLAAVPGGAVGAPRATPAPPPIQENPAPAGANDWNCRPSAAHPHPVILMHGFGAPAAGHFSAYSPYLKAQGYCVFTGTYGTVEGVPLAGQFGGFQRVEYSAAQLDAFVDKVRTVTGAAKVDIVGHSEGGVMPRYYLKYLGGATEVHSFIAWAPPNHGLTLSGLYTLANQIPGFDETLLPAICEVCAQLTNANGFLDRLNAGDETPGSVNYTVIASKSDLLVTPYPTSFLHGDRVDNILLQDVYPWAVVGHIQMAFDPRVWTLTDDALRDQT